MFEILEKGRVDDPQSLYCDLFLSILIVVNLIAVCLETIDSLFDKLGDASALLMRTKEARYKELGLKGQILNKKEMCHILAENPKLIERPIVVSGDKAVLGRPPENVLILLQD